MEANCQRKRKKEENVINKVMKKDKQPANFSKRNKKSRKSFMNEHKSINGSILVDKYIPEELLTEILCYVDSQSLLNCQLVCQYWKMLIKSRVWHKKAEQTIQQNISFDKRIPWMIYYCISNKMPFNRNLIKNHSGEDGLDCHWDLPPIKGIHWTVENSMVSLLPDDSSFGVQKVCFVTSTSMTWKYQLIDLIKEGFKTYLLDYLQPTIQISEWYCCSNTPAKYICDIELLKDNGEKKLIFCSLENYDDSSWDMYDHFTFSRIIKCGEENHWFKYEREFKNYGRGLRKIKFIHGGRKLNHYDNGVENVRGAKMARACIKIDLPSLDYSYIQSLSSDY